MWLSVAAQSESFEKRAISAAQQISASSLDAKLPNRSFVAWLNEVVGQEAGVIWQLAECGADGAGQDAPACAEAIMLLPNGDTVIVGISVGTFKKGLIGNRLSGVAVIKSGEKLYPVRRLSDLPGMLRAPRSVPLALPDLQAGPLRVETRFLQRRIRFWHRSALVMITRAGISGAGRDAATPPSPLPRSNHSEAQGVRGSHCH